MALPSDLNKLRVVDLKEELTKRNLPVKGKKPELVARLQQAIDEENANNLGASQQEEKNDPGEHQDHVYETNQAVEGAEIKDQETGNKQEFVQETQPSEPLAETDAPKQVLQQRDNAPLTESSSTPTLDTTEDEKQQKAESLEPEKEQVPSASIRESEKESRTEQRTEQNASETETPSTRTAETAETMAVDEERGIKRKALATEDESTEKRPRNDDDTKEQSIVPTSNAIIITNLVRPLITRRVQEYVSQHGTVKRFFLDAIKTHAYVIYENNEQAVAAYRGMDGIQFPKDTGRNIAVRGMTAEQVESMIEQEQAAAAKHIKFDWESALKLVCGGDAPAAQAATSQESTRRPRFSGMGQITRQLQQAAAAPVVERRTVRTTPPTTSNKLDTLFRKTKSTPALYYMPVSDEVAKARLERFRDEVK